MSARVFLGERLVGELRRYGDSVAFFPDIHYCDDPLRPVLGRAFEELELHHQRPVVNRDDPRQLPEFFRNLLPEGALRKLVEASANTTHEFAILVHLGENLPGNIFVRPTSADWEEELPAAPKVRSASASDPLRFSLAGVQLKTEVFADEDRVTLPLVGESGAWIAKFPSAVHAALPENEYGMLKWARACGLRVPDHRLVRVDQIEGLPQGFPREGQALCVRRFDRDGPRRIHQEDFSQVFSLQPEDKYRDELPNHLHYAAFAAVIERLCGSDDLTEYVQRLAFMVLSGNGDAHPKNWAFIYPSGVRPQLAPAYDLVSTLAYDVRLLALGIGGPEDPNHTPRVPIGSFDADGLRAIEAATGAIPGSIVQLARAFASVARMRFSELRAELPPLVRDELDKHLESVSFD